MIFLLAKRVLFVFISTIAFLELLSSFNSARQMGLATIVISASASLYTIQLALLLMRIFWNLMRMIGHLQGNTFEWMLSIMGNTYSGIFMFAENQNWILKSKCNRTNMSNLSFKDSTQWSFSRDKIVISQNRGKHNDVPTLKMLKTDQYQKKS